MKEHEEYASELLEKDETQLENVEPITKALSDMGTIWKAITTKLDENSKCYICKKGLGKTKKDKEKFNIISVPYDKVDEGLIAFVSVCQTCNTVPEVIEDPDFE